MTSWVIRKGVELIWTPAGLTPPPIEVTVKLVRSSRNQFVGTCRQGDKEWQRTFPIPLPASLKFKGENG